MKKLLALIMVLCVVVTSVSAFQFGVAGGIAPYDQVRVVDLPSNTNNLGYNLFVFVPWTFGSTNIYGSFEAGMMATMPDFGLNLGYTFHITNSIALTPYIGGCVSFFFLGGIGGKAGFMGAYTLGPGDIILDARFTYVSGLLGRMSVETSLGYVFRF